MQLPLRTTLQSRALRLIALLTGLVLLTALTTVAKTLAPVQAAGSVDVFVGYADTARLNPAGFLTPWDGSPNTTFEGCTPGSACSFDAGAVRVVNNTSASITVNSIDILFDTCDFTGWPGATLAAGSELIVTQTGSGAGNGCIANAVNPITTMDSSDIGPNGAGWAGVCSPSGLTPNVKVTIDGVPSTFADSAQILNTGGVDQASCVNPRTGLGPGNESTQWSLIGTPPCPGAMLTLAPPSQTDTVGTPATVTGTLTNNCGTALSNTTVDFSVVSGPNAGHTGSAATDANGQAVFTYNSATTGIDTVQASVTNPAGTFTSNTAQVNWIAPISATGANVGGTEGQEFTPTVATFTDPDTTAQASEYKVSIDWGDGQTSAGTLSRHTHGPFRVSGTHIYADEGSYSIKTTITDIDGGDNTSVSTTSTATVADARLTATRAPISATEGQLVSGATVATFTDANPTSTTADFSSGGGSVSITWGDSTPASTGTVVADGGGAFHVTGSHTYAEEGSYTIAVKIVDDGGSTASASSTAKVADAPLTASCAAPQFSLQAFNGKTATFTDAASPSGTLSDFSATINWGDSSSSAGTVSGPNGGPYAVTGSHTYSSTGHFTIATTIKDVGGSTATATCSNVLIFAFAPGGGSFVIGDKESGVGTAVTEWGAQWWKDNATSTGSKAASFKGFADSPTTPSCGANWTADPGNSTPPPSGPLPEYMGVIVTSSYAQSGSSIAGNTAQIVVIHTAPGYQPDPGHAGTGTVVAQVCTAP